MSKRYGEGDAAVDALKDVSMSVAPGEVVGLVFQAPYLIPFLDVTDKIIPIFKRIYHIRDGQTVEEAGEGRDIS